MVAILRRGLLYICRTFRAGNMGCICSKGAPDKVDDYEREKEPNKSSVQLVAPAPSKRQEFVVEVGGVDGSFSRVAKTTSQAPANAAKDNEEKKRMVVQKPTSGHHQRWATMDLGSSREHPEMSRIVSMPNGAKGEQIAAGWPSWLTSVAGEAIKGLLPRRAESFQKLDKVSSLYIVQCLSLFDYVAVRLIVFLF